MIQRRLKTPSGFLVYEYTEKKIRRITLRIYPDGHLAVSAPHRTSKKQVEDFLLSHLSKIEQSRAHFAEDPKNRPLQDGDTVYYSGNPYTLSLHTGKEFFGITEDKITLTLPRIEDAKKVLQKHLSVLLRPQLIAVCKQVEPFFLQRGGRIPSEIRFRHMKKAWGMCNTATGALTFSQMLCEVPPACLFYVVCHEYAHFVHPEHTPAFYRLIAEICPDHELLLHMLYNKSYR